MNVTSKNIEQPNTCTFKKKVFILAKITTVVAGIFLYIHGNNIYREYIDSDKKNYSCYVKNGNVAGEMIGGILLTIFAIGSLCLDRFEYKRDNQAQLHSLI